MSYETIIYQPGPVARVILNRPERQNAQSWRMLAEMEQAFNEACSDPTVRKGAHDLNHRGADDHAHHGGQNEQHEREENLDRGLCRRFFGAQPPGGAHRVRDRSQRGTDLRAQLFALHQRSGKRFDVLDGGANGETSQRLAKRAAGGELG